MKAGIVGATGYTGGELLRLLTMHPHVEVTSVTSGTSAGKTLIDRQPFLSHNYTLTLETLDPEKISKKVDLVFIALSHTDAMDAVHRFINLGKKVIDLSADYRLQSADLYRKWYKTPHRHPHLLKKRVYGLPERYRNKIKDACLIANPGCYPTGALLPMIPLLDEGLIDTTREIIIDAKSGVSGAGRAPSVKTHFPEVNEGLVAYNIGNHRHLSEIEQETGSIVKHKVKIVFTPYLLPINRGLLTTIYFPLNKKLSQKKLESILKKFYKYEPFVRITKDSPNLSHIRGTNYCDIGIFATASGRMAILISAIDNLVKGAAGQAIQNMNIMMDWDEGTGLCSPGLFP